MKALSPDRYPRLRHLKWAAATVLPLLPQLAYPLAELEVTEYSRTSPGVSATHGYFPARSPDLVSSTQDLRPVNDGSGDILASYANLYRDNERVNAGRSGGGVIAGPLDPAHSYAKASGYADAGTNTLGGYTNLGAFAYVASGGHLSTAAAMAETKIQFTFVVDPGSSESSVGDTVTGLRWEFNTHGDLTALTATYPATTASSAASMVFSGNILRGPTGMCGIFDCPHGAVAAADTTSGSQSRRCQYPSLPLGTSGWPQWRCS